MPAALLLLVFFQAYLDRKSYLELSKGETTTSADATVVLDGRAADDGPQLVHRTGSDLGSLCLTSIATRLFLASLYFQASGTSFSKRVLESTAGAATLKDS